MAMIIPSDLTKLALSGVHEPEIDTLRQLREQLPDNYTVFHGVHWTRQYKGATVYGEIDFVVLNQAGEVLCIEQKNGPLQERDGELIKRYANSSKNVADQLHRSINNIRQKYEFMHGRDGNLRPEYLVYCPEHALKMVSAAGIDRDRIVDANRKGELAALIKSIMPPSQASAPHRHRKLKAFFEQSFEVVADVHAHIAAQDRNYTRLSGGLADVTRNIVMAPLKLRVEATAGGGKTCAGLHYYRELTGAGKNPLMLCFNRTLAERLKHLAGPGGYVNTWYGFIDDYLKACGDPLDFSTMRTQPDFWEAALVKLEHHALNNAATANGCRNWRFDALLVDEAQDFMPGWYDTLRLFLVEEAAEIWLEDPYQNLRGTSVTSLTDQHFVGYRSRFNYRSPERIATFINTVFPEFQFTCANDLPGMGYGVHHYNDPAEQPKIVGKIVGRLLAQRFKPQDIAIISCRGMSSTVFADLVRVGNHTLSRFTGEYDLFGNQVVSKGQVLFDTVARFKGQQAPAIILVDIDPRAARLATELRTLFCGMTRATVRLEMVCREDSEWVQDRLLTKAG